MVSSISTQVAWPWLTEEFVSRSNSRRIFRRLSRRFIKCECSAEWISSFEAFVGGRGEWSRHTGNSPLSLPGAWDCRWAWNLRHRTGKLFPMHLNHLKVHPLYRKKRKRRRAQQREREDGGYKSLEILVEDFAWLFLMEATCSKMEEKRTTFLPVCRASGSIINSCLLVYYCFCWWRDDRVDSFRLNEQRFSPLESLAQLAVILHWIQVVTCNGVSRVNEWYDSVIHTSVHSLKARSSAQMNSPTVKRRLFHDEWWRVECEAQEAKRKKTAKGKKKRIHESKLKSGHSKKVVHTCTRPFECG